MNRTLNNSYVIYEKSSSRFDHQKNSYASNIQVSKMIYVGITSVYHKSSPKYDILNKNVEP